MTALDRNVDRVLGHLIVRLGTRMSVLPMHGKQKELGTGLVNRIKKDLGLR
jgi:mRNA interferase HicA